MKYRQLLAVLLMLVPAGAFAKLKITPVLLPSYWVLQETSGWNGRQRNSVQLTLPPHTVKLIYTLSSVDEYELELVNVNGVRHYSFRNHRNREPLWKYLLAFYSGHPEDSIKSVPYLAPMDTVAYFSSYLFTDSTNMESFIWEKPAEYVQPYSFARTKGNLVALDINDDPEYNSLWLGFANISSGRKAYIVAEAAALVEVPDDTVAIVALTPEERKKKNAGFKEAYFPGPRNVYSYLADNMRQTPRMAHGCVTIEGEVTEKGLLHNLHVLIGGDCEFDAEVLHQLNIMPYWVPATQFGEPVKSLWVKTFCD